MPAMPQAKFHHKAKNGEERSLVSKVSVDVDGCFHVTFDDDLEECVSANLRDHTSVTTNRTGTFRVSGVSLHDCKLAVGLGLKQWLQCEIIEEHVIRYGVETKSAYWKMTDGQIFANGSDAHNHPDHSGGYGGGPDSDGKWHGDLHATAHNKGYMVSLYASICKKVIYRRGDIDETEYKCPDFDNFTHDTWGERLNNFVGLTEDGGWGSNDLDCEEIQYTEEAAKFFYDMLIGMCTFADKIESFFEEPENVLLAIASGARLLAAPKVET